MITYISKATSELYSALFAEASEALNLKDVYVPVTITFDSYEPNKYYYLDDEGEYVIDTNKYSEETFPTGTQFYTYDKITSLNEYFAHMEEFVSKEELKRFTVLPIESDEGYFEVNANTRAITVPSNFVTNGISVQGDEVAEVVYFKIDRYFDSTDLYMQDALIQWKNANGEEGASYPWIKDVIYEGSREFVRVGWPLSSKVTKKSGTVQFSLRFYKLNEAGTVTYSFSTLTQTVNVKDALDYNFKDVNDNPQLYIDDVIDMMQNRVENSIVVNGDGKTAESPEWTETFATLSDKIYIFEDGVFKKYDATADKGKTIYLDIEGYDAKGQAFGGLLENFNADGTRTVRVKAFSPDGGIISYRWKKTELPDENGLAASLPFSSTEEYTISNDTEPVENMTYYTRTSDTKAGNVVYSYKVYTNIAKGFPEDYISNCVGFNASGNPIDSEGNVLSGTILFKKYYRGDLDSVGKYIVIATNRVGNSSKATKPAECSCLVPEPSDIKAGILTINDKNSIILTDAPTYEAITAEQYAANPDGPYYVSSDNQWVEYTGSVYTSQLHKKIDTVGSLKLAASAFNAADTGSNKKTFVWYKDALTDTNDMPDYIESEDTTRQEGTTYFYRILDETNSTNENKVYFYKEYTRELLPAELASDEEGSDEVVYVINPNSSKATVTEDPSYVYGNESDSSVELTGLVKDDAEGYYFVEVINEKNNSSTLPVKSTNRVRVTRPAEKLVVTQDGKIDITVAKTGVASMTVKNAFTADSHQKNDVRTKDDSITYKWYEYQGFEEVDGTQVIPDADKVAFADGTYIPTEKDIYIPDSVSGFDSVTYSTADGVKIDIIGNDEGCTIQLDGGGYAYEYEETESGIKRAIQSTGGIFYCVVTNTFNGSEASTCSDVFKITVSD